MYAPQQYHPVLPFNLNFPMERVKASYEKSMIKEAIEEVLKPHLQNMDKFVGSKSGSGSVPTVSSGGHESGANVNLVLVQVQDALDALNRALQNQGDTSQEMKDLKEKLEELDTIKQTLEDERTVNAATLALMEKAARLVANADSEDEMKATLDELERANPEFKAAIDGVSDKMKDVEEKLSQKTSQYDQLAAKGDANTLSLISTLKTDIENLQEEKDALVNKANDLATKTQDEKNKAKEDFDVELAKKQNELDAAKTRLEGLGEGETVKSLREEVARAKEALETLQAAKGEVDTELEGLRTGDQIYANLEREYNTLKAAKEHLDGVVLELNTKIERLEKTKAPASPTGERPIPFIPPTPGGDSDSSNGEFKDAEGGSSGARSENPSPSSRAGKGPSFGEGEEGGGKRGAPEEQTGGGGAEGGAVNEKPVFGEDEKEKLVLQLKKDVRGNWLGGAPGKKPVDQSLGKKLKTVGARGKVNKQVDQDILLKALAPNTQTRIYVDNGETEVPIGDTYAAQIFKTVVDEKNILEEDQARAFALIVDKVGLKTPEKTYMEKIGESGFDLGKLFMWL